MQSVLIIGLVDIVFANCLGDLGSIPGGVISKTLKMVLDTSLLNTQQYKVCIKGKEKRPPLHLSVVAIEKGAFESPSTTVAYLLSCKELETEKRFLWIIIALSSGAVRICQLCLCRGVRPPSPIGATCWPWMATYDALGRNPGGCKQLLIRQPSGHVTYNTPLWLQLGFTGGWTDSIWSIDWSCQALASICLVPTTQPFFIV